MTKKFLALTMVLVLAAGFAAIAAEHEDDRALTGTWENELILDPDSADDTFAGYDSVLSVDYTTGGISYSSMTTLNLDGFAEQEFGVDSSIGLLDLSSTLNMDVGDTDLRYWESSANLTLGGVSIGTTFYLQNVDWTPSSSSAYEADFWPEYIPSSDYPLKPTFGNVSTDAQTDSFVVGSTYSDGEYSFTDVDSPGSFHDYGSGLELTFSGETPGGVSVDVTNTFGMMPTSEAETELSDMLDSKVKTMFVDTFVGEDALSDVTGQEGINWLESLIGQNSTSVSATNLELAKALLVSEIGIGDVNDSLEEYSSFTQLAADFDDWADNYNSATSGNALGNSDSGVSDEVRDAALAIVQKSVTISGIAAETDTVVNTEFDMGLVDFMVVPEAKDTSSSASVSLVLDTVEVGPAEYGSSSLQYYSTLLELENLSIGCCDFSNETKFTEHDGFKYTEFDFSMEMETFPVDIDATLKWDNDPDTDADGKTVTLTPSLTTDWSCFEVYTTLGSADGDIDSLSIDGFEISAELGHVKVTSVTALGSSDLTDLSTSGSYHGFDEVLRIDKIEGDLDFTLDLYTDLYNSSTGASGSGLAPEAIEGSASYPISDQFDLGSTLAWYNGLEEVGLTFDYSF